MDTPVFGLILDSMYLQLLVWMQKQFWQNQFSEYQFRIKPSQRGCHLHFIMFSHGGHCCWICQETGALCMTSLGCRPVSGGVEGLDPPPPQMARGLHFVGSCNLYPQNSGLECWKSGKTLLRPIITKFPGGACPLELLPHSHCVGANLTAP